MIIGPTTYFGEERVFVDREACIQTFRKNIYKSGIQDYNVLFYHGVAGIGKSKLQKKLQNILSEEYPKIMWIAIDLSTKTYREIGTFLIVLRNKVQEKCKAKFYLFNIAHAIYWKKLHPEIPLLKENYPLIKEGEFFSKIIDVLNEFGPARLIWDIINNAPDSVITFFKEHSIDINKLAAMEAPEIEKLLPSFFAADFTYYLGTDSKVYIFIDTYEALWEDLRKKDSFYEKDEWIRDNLIPNMPGVSWVICGREKLLWDSKYHSDWEIGLEQHSVDELPENYCTEFLKDCDIENKDIRDVIIKASEGIPYYLNLSVDTFEKISKKREPIPEYFGRTQPEIFKTFVKYLGKNEIKALEVLSVPNSWDKDLFKILMAEFDTGYHTSEYLELIKFSFIKTNSEGKYFIHQLMRNSLQAYDDPTERKDIHKFLLTYYSNKIENSDIQAITKEHEIALTEAFYHAKKALEAEDLFNWFITVSYPFNRVALWKLIASLYEELLQILETKLGPQHPDVATTLNNLAEQYRHIGEYEKALPLYQRALEIDETVLDPQHLSVAAPLNNLAIIYERKGDYKKALPLYQRALEINKTVLGPQHPYVATTIGNLAGLYERIGEYEKALTFCKRALDIREKVLGPHHPDVASSLNNLAELYRHIGEYEKALPLYQRALSVREKVLGSQHPDIAKNLNDLAALIYHLGDYEKALPLFQRSLEVNEKILGQGSISVVAILNNLARTYERMGNYGKALPFLQRAVDISENALGSQNPDVAYSLSNLAGLYDSMGEYEKALPLYQRALDVCEKALGPEHPQVAETLNDLALTYHHVEDYEKALSLYQRALEISETVLGPQHPNVATTLDNLATLYHYMGDYEKALSLFQRALEIKETILDPQHPSVGTTLNNLAALHESMESYDKALPLFQKALDIYEKALGPEHPDVAATLNNLAILYYSMGDYGKALPLYQRALDIREKALGPNHPKP